MKTIVEELKTTRTINVATAEDFINFLEKHEALYKFLVNGRNSCHPHWRKIFSLKEPIEAYCKEYVRISGTNRKGADLLSVGFIWLYTPEGLSYWVNLTGEWRDFILYNNIEKFEA